MISKDMYKVLKKIPTHPKWIFSSDLLKKVRLEKESLEYLTTKAMNTHRYVVVASRGYSNDPRLSLTEEGASAVEEYQAQHSASKKSTWALIIAGLSFLSSVVAIIISYIR